MIKIPSVNKQNWRKVLRELDISKFPSISPFLKDIRKKMLSKEKLLFKEEQLGYAGMVKFVISYEQELNKFYVDNIDFSRFSKRMPYEFQKEGAKFLLKNNRCILCDDMGLGKTMTSIYASLNMEDEHKILIVTLKSLKYNFANEIKYFDKRIAIPNKKWECNKFTIVHYESFIKFQKDIIAEGFSVLILDEGHKIRNHKTKRAKVIFDTIRVLKPLKIWLLTGTPIDNRPSDYYSLLHLIKHPVADNWINFVQRYCAAYQDQWGHWNTSGASNLEELNFLTKDVFLRRLKTNVGIEMPKKMRSQLVLEMQNTKGYNQIIEDYRKKKHANLVEEVDYTKGVESIYVEEITQIMLQRQFCAMEKIKDGSLVEIVEDYIDADDTTKIIVFTNFTKVIDTIKETFGDICVTLDGRILDPEKRQKIVDNFNSDPKLKVFAINMKVGGTGYNIQSANKIIVNDMDWVPSSMLQAEDRAWRIGQLRDVEVIYLLYGDTVEIKLYETIEKKMKIISTIVEGKSENYFHDSIFELDEKTEKEERIDLIIEILSQINM